MGEKVTEGLEPKERGSLDKGEALKGVDRRREPWYSSSLSQGWKSQSLGGTSAWNPSWWAQRLGIPFQIKVDFCIGFVRQRNRQSTAKPHPKEKVLSLLNPWKKALGFPEKLCSATLFTSLCLQSQDDQEEFESRSVRGKKIKFINVYKNPNQNRSHIEDIFKIQLAVFRQREVN